LQRKHISLGPISPQQNTNRPTTCFAATAFQSVTHIILRPMRDSDYLLIDWLLFLVETTSRCVPH